MFADDKLVKMQTTNIALPENTLSVDKILSSYIKSLFWVAVIITFAMFFLDVANILKVDFLNVNPNRSQLHAASLPFSSVFIFFIIDLIGIFIVFSLSQIAQALIGSISIQQFKKLSLYVIAATVPFTTVLSWYCYDYLTPTDFNLGINVGAEWTPYQHGLTPQRYLVMFCLQSCVTIFSTVRLKFEIADKNLAKRNFLFIVIGIFSTIGWIIGFLK